MQFLSKTRLHRPATYTLERVSVNLYRGRSTADEVVAGVDLSRKTIVVTECDSSVGVEIMKALAANGARVIGLARSTEMAETACRKASRSSIPLACDMRSEESIAAAVAALRLHGPLAAIIVNCTQVPGPIIEESWNAGTQLRTDHIACFRLITSLIDYLHLRTGRIVLENDARAHHASVLLARELSHRVVKRGIAVNFFDTTAPTKHEDGTLRGRAVSALIAVARWRRRSPSQLAAIPVFLAASPHVGGATGWVWSACATWQTDPLLDARSAARDYLVSIALAGVQ